MLMSPFFVAGSALLGHILLSYSTGRKLLEHSKLVSPIQTKLTRSSKTLCAKLTKEFVFYGAFLRDTMLFSSTTRISH